MCDAHGMTGEGTPSQSTAGSPEVQPHDVAAPTAATAGSMPPGSTATASTGSLRASDLDRNALVQQLAKATGEGRITLEEFADAAGAAYAAVTLAELDDLHRSFGLTALLPPPPDAARTATATVTATATATATAPFDTAPLASTPASVREGSW